jgi:hypothetical protein
VRAVVEIERGQVGQRREVLLQLRRAERQHVLHPRRAERVAAHERERRRILDDEREVRAVAGLDELGEAAGAGPRGAHPPARLRPGRLDDGAEDRLLVVEGVVERAGGELGPAHDVAHARRLEAELPNASRAASISAARFAAFVRSRRPAGSTRPR